jgi:hypothetical protein
VSRVISSPPVSSQFDEEDEENEEADSEPYWIHAEG